MNNLKWQRKDSFILASLTLLCLLIRLPHLMTPYIINKDGMNYIWASQLIAQGYSEKGLELTGTNAFPYFIALLHAVTGDWLSAARIWPFIFGVVTIVPMYLIARELLGARAWIAGIFYCISPEIVALSVDVVRDPVFYFFFAFFVWLFIKAFYKDDWKLYFFSGMSALGAMAIRQNGLLLLVAGMLFSAYLGWRTKRPRQNALHALSMMLPALVAASAMFAFLEMESPVVKSFGSYYRQAKTATLGSEWLENKMEEAISSSRPRLVQKFFHLAWDEKHAVFVSDFLEHWTSAAHPLLFVLFLAGITSAGAWRGTRWRWLALLTALWILMGYLRMSGAFALSKRHLIPLVMINYIYAGYGLHRLVQYCRNRWPGVCTARRVVVTLLLITAIVIMPKALKPLRADKLPRREAGEWIQSRHDDHVVIVTNRSRVGFYAGAGSTTVEELREKPTAESVYLTLDMDRKPADQIKRILKATSSDHVYVAVVGKQKPSQPPDWLIQAASSDRQIIEGPVFQSNGETVALYKMVRRSSD